jgi:hypothetical protein
MPAVQRSSCLGVACPWSFNLWAIVRRWVPLRNHSLTQTTYSGWGSAMGAGGAGVGRGAGTGGDSQGVRVTRRGAGWVVGGWLGSPIGGRNLPLVVSLLNASTIYCIVLRVLLVRKVTANLLIGMGLANSLRIKRNAESAVRTAADSTRPGTRCSCPACNSLIRKVWDSTDSRDREIPLFPGSYRAITTYSVCFIYFSGKHRKVLSVLSAPVRVGVNTTGIRNQTCGQQRGQQNYFLSLLSAFLSAPSCGFRPFQQLRMVG